MLNAIVHLLVRGLFFTFVAWYWKLTYSARRNKIKRMFVACFKLFPDMCIVCVGISSQRSGGRRHCYTREIYSSRLLTHAFFLIAISKIPAIQIEFKELAAHQPTVIVTKPVVFD